MPQANITYDAPYNRSMVKFIEELDHKHWEKAYPAYHPNPMGFRLGAFHGEQPLVGGGSSPMKYNPSGNSSAYPMMNMHSGMAVSSGGARYSGVDGAVGGKKGFNVFDEGFKFGHDVLGPALMGKGQEGGSTYNQRLARRTRNTFKKVGQVLAPAVPFLKKNVLPVLVDVGKKVAQKELETAVGLGMSGGRKKKINFLGALKNVGHLAGEVIQKPFEMAVTSAVGLGRKKAAAPRGRNVRAEIVKKVMKERGVKMIEASKIIKKEGLY